MKIPGHCRHRYVGVKDVIGRSSEPLSERGVWGSTELLVNIACRIYLYCVADIFLCSLKMLWRCSAHNSLSGNREKNEVAESNHHNRKRHQSELWCSQVP